MIKKTLLANAALACCATMAAASDQTVLPEVTVTSDYREIQLMDTPVSLTVIPEDAISNRSAQHIEEILNLAPNVNFASGGSRARYFQIRGIGERGQFQEPVNPSVGLIIDDVDFTGIGGAATLFDVEQVEILRGPQGTRYGANSLAGLIHVTGNQPTEETEGQVEVTAAEYDTYSAGAALGGKITEGWLGRIAIQQFNSDGYTENRFLGRDDTNERDELTARGKLRWLTNESLTVDFSGFYSDVDNGYDGFSLDNDRDTITDEPGRDTQETVAGAVKAVWTGAHAFTLESILAHNDSKTQYTFDEDWAFDGFHPFGYSSTDNYRRDWIRTSYEIRLLSNESGALFDDSTHWLVGLYVLDTAEDLERRNAFIVGDFVSDNQITTIAAFTQFDTQLSEKTNLTLGLRVEDRQTDYQGRNLGAGNVATAFNNDRSEILWGGKLAIDHMLNDDTLLFASLSRGFKAGGLNSDPNLPTGLVEYDTEFVWSFETGLKASLLNNSLKARVALFYIDRNDQQVDDFTCVNPVTGVVTTDNSSQCNVNFIGFLGNAAEGKSYGAEVELQWQATEQWQFFSALGLLESEIIDYVNANGDDLDGRNQAHAPEYQYSLGTQFKQGNWYARLEVEGRDDFFFSEGHNAQSENYDLVHARIGYAAGAWDVALWGRNVTDKDYAVRGFRFGNDPRINYAATTYVQLGEPRIVGVTGKYRF